MAAAISSWFCAPNEYFAVLESPREYHLVRNREIAQRKNVLAKIHPRWIILAGLSPPIQRELQAKFPNQRLVTIAREDEIDERFPAIVESAPDTTVECSEADIAKGLLLAKANASKLVVDDSAPPIALDTPEFQNRSHLVHLSDYWDVVPVIAANYAFAIGATIEYGEEIDDELSEQVCEALLVRSVCEGENRAAAAGELVEEQSHQLNLAQTVDSFEFVTYMARQIPYGYFTPSRPSTHLLSLRFLGLTICDSIVYATAVNCIRSMVIADPGFFDESETDAVAGALEPKGTHVRWIRGDEATVYSARMHVQYFPYDLLFICSHAGRVSGTRYTIRVHDALRQAHTVVLDSALEIAAPPGQISESTKFEAVDYREFASFDGTDWASSDKASYCWEGGTLLEQLMGTNPCDWDIIEYHDIPYVSGSFRIQCADGFCVMAMHVLAEHEAPFVFNNSCSSVHSMAAHCLNSGAISYVGTLFPVGTSAAPRVAEAVFATVDSGTPLPNVLWEAQNSVYDRWEDRPYVHYGCHFLTINSPTADMAGMLRTRIHNGHARWQEVLERGITDEQEREATEHIVQFLDGLRNDPTIR
jgi:hypothetical protein